MKRQREWVITLIITIIMSCGMKSAGAEREYLPILEDGKSWVLVEKRKPLRPGDKDVAYYDVSVTGDTIFGDKQCKKVSLVGRDEEHSSSRSSSKRLARRSRSSNLTPLQGFKSPCRKTRAFFAKRTPGQAH